MSAGSWSFVDTAGVSMNDGFSACAGFRIAEFMMTVDSARVVERDDKMILFSFFFVREIFGSWRETEPIQAHPPARLCAGGREGKDL